MRARLYIRKGDEWVMKEVTKGDYGKVMSSIMRIYIKKYMNRFECQVRVSK